MPSQLESIAGQVVDLGKGAGRMAESLGTYRPQFDQTAATIKELINRAATGSDEKVVDALSTAKKALEDAQNALAAVNAECGRWATSAVR